MNIVVPIKQVPDTGINLRIKEDALGLEENAIKWVLNPYDEFALQEALRLKAELGGRVLVVTIGPEHAKETLLSVLALGADEAHHLLLPQNLFDPLQTAVLLAEKIKTFSFSLILCGKLATDTNDFAVPQMLAGQLNLSFVTNVNRLENKNKRLSLTRECAAGKQEVLESDLPLLVSADKGLNEPRYPTLAGIMKAKTKPFHTEAARPPEETGFRLLKLEAPPERPSPQMISGSPDEQVTQLIHLLKEKEKLLQFFKDGTKLSLKKT